METIKENNVIGTVGLDNPLNTVRINRSGKDWSKDELKTLKGLAVDGISINDLQKAIPSRTDGAISRKASDFDFGTKEIDGIKVLKKRITSIKKADEVKTTTNSSKSFPSDVLMNHGSSISEFSLAVMEANSTVIDIFNSYRLEVTPEIIATLTTHIANTKGANNGN